MKIIKIIITIAITIVIYLLLKTKEKIQRKKMYLLLDKRGGRSV